MKKLTLLMYTLFLALTLSAQTDTTDVGVIINGIKWATRNVDNPRTFTENPEDSGGYYTWDEAQNVCSAGWRLPTLEEINSLLSIESNWTTSNGINGRQFGSDSILLFLPAAGNRSYVDGALLGIGSWGVYWSGVPHKISEMGAYVLHFTSDDMVWYGTERRLGFSVRCVAE